MIAGGLEQLQRRYTETELINNYSENECVELINLSHILATFAATFAAALAGRDDLANEFSGEINKINVQP